MTMKMHARWGTLALFVVAGTLVACSGGASVPSAAGGARSASANATLHLIVPQKKSSTAERRATYISPSTTQLAWTLDGFQQTPVALATSNPDCTNGTDGLACTVTFQVAPGAHTFVFSLEDANGTVLSQATDVTATLVAGTTNALSVTLGGIAQNISVTTSATAGPMNPSQYVVYGNAPLVLTINALDADGNVIVGPGSLGITATIAPQPESSPPIATATLAPGANNTWTLTSTYVATAPTIAGSTALVVSATPVPNSGGAAISATYDLQFYDPWIYVAQSGSGQVTSYDEQGRAQGVTISGLNAPAAIAPGGTTDAGYLYIADASSIHAYGIDGTPATLAGSFPGASASVGLAFDSNLSNLYALDVPAPSLQAYDAQGNAASVLTSVPTIANPTGIAFDDASGDLYVSSASGIVAYAENGVVDPAVAAFVGVDSPTGVAYDSIHDDILVLNGNGTVGVYAPGGGAPTSTFGVIASPTAILFDPFADWMYVANASSIAAYDHAGAPQTLAGSWPNLNGPKSMVVIP